VAYDPTAIKIFAEACRAVLLAELDPAPDEIAYNSYNQAILDLHSLVLARRSQEPHGAEMLGVIKEWEPQLNPQGRIAWRATVEQCLRHARVIFAKLRSIPADRLPKPLLEDNHEA
jgi:hypothetical protein